MELIRKETATIKLTIKDLEELFRKEFKMGTGTLNITDVKRKEVYSIGNFDSDYTEHFDGLSVYWEE